jgi:hypothetical protein
MHKSINNNINYTTFHDDRFRHSSNIIDGRGSIPDRAMDNSLHSIQAGSDADPASCQMDIGGCFPGDKATVA